ncbi:MAG: toxin-antitoxin system HicB family antitoxin [Deltaproteobacteria bacterium]|nr:toxin-antitoxin system HicB family antitoxin [Deltaproteobacteria bacterium]
MVLKKKARSPDARAPASGEPPEPLPQKRRVGRPKEIHYDLEKKFTLMLPKEVHKALKIKSAEQEVPMTTMIIEAIIKTYNL